MILKENALIFSENIDSIGVFDDEKKVIVFNPNRTENFSLDEWAGILGHEFCHASVMTESFIPGIKDTKHNALLEASDNKDYIGGVFNFEAYRNQPVEMVEQRLGDAITNGTLDEIPSEIGDLNDNVFVYSDGDQKNMGELKERIKESPEVLAALKDDGVLTRKEAESLLPTKDNMKNKIFSKSDGKVLDLLVQYHADGQDFTGSKFREFEMDGISLSESNFEGVEITDSHFSFCDFSDVDLSKIKSFENSSMEACFIADTPENRKFVEDQQKNNPNCFDGIEWQQKDLASQAEKASVLDRIRMSEKEKGNKPEKITKEEWKEIWENEKSHYQGQGMSEKVLEGMRRSYPFNPETGEKWEDKKQTSKELMKSLSSMKSGDVNNHSSNHKQKINKKKKVLSPSS